MNDTDLAQFAKALNKAGIQLQAIYEPIGCEFFLKPSDVAAFLNDKDAFFAAECGLSKADYVDWKRFIAGGCACTARRKDGTPCKRKAKGGEELSPQDYVERKKAGTLVCGFHSK
jgi:hypothetical protein